jgi:signal transduction histidine kinase
MDEEAEQIHTFLSTPDGQAIAAFHLPYNSNPFFNTIEDWRAKRIHVTHWDLEEFSTLADALVKEGQIANQEQYLKVVPKGGLHLHYIPFLQGIVYVGNTTALTDDNLHLVQSVADAFSTAYARYEDFNKIESAKAQVEKTLVDLKAAQSLLVQSEKMASLGELTAGIAHEIQNPLNFVNNFSEVSTELVDEMNEELAIGNTQSAKEIANDLKQNLEKINHHGKRAGDIVKGMLQHSRSNSGVKEPTNINALADEYLRLAYHGLRAKDKSFNATMKTDYDETIGNINIIPQDIGRVILNLITNAFYAAPLPPEGGFSDPDYIHSPTVWLSTKKMGNKVLISVRDNGPGIPQKILDKIFQPFFTTKPTGQGTGLGLSLSYDIVKAHGGELKVETKESEGTEFIILLPV